MPSSQTQPVHIDFNQRVPMRDGVTLSVDVYRPAASTNAKSTYPVILTRTPYMKADSRMIEMGRYFAERGYAFVAMDVRGRGDSDGQFVPYFNEGIDGYDAIEWCAAQPWSNGNVGTIGGSYPGRIQWLAALHQPPHLRTMIVLVAPSDPFVETPTGLPSPMHLCWLHLVSGRVVQPMSSVDWEQMYDHLPLLTMDERAGRHIEFWRRDIEHAQLDNYWEPLCYQTKFHRVNVPVLHISGWYDDEQIGTPLNYIGMTQHAATPFARANQRLLMGPWGHAVNTVSKIGEVDFGRQSLIDLRGEEARWFDRWLKDSSNKTSVTLQTSVTFVTNPTSVTNSKPETTNTLSQDAPVRIFIMGTNEWRDEQEWPLARTQWTPYYLHSKGNANSRFGDGTLSIIKPSSQQTPDNYRYDPSRPVPFITEPTSSQIGGPDDYSAIERRDDVLVYVTEPLVEDTEVTGPVRVELYASSSAPDTDFMAKLVDIHPNGFTQRLSDGMVRARFRDGMDKPSLIEPGKIYRYSIDCWNTAQVFKAGHRIGLEISSSAFPKYDRNLNTGEQLGVTAEMAVAEQRIYHDEAHPSAIMLPIIPER